MQFWEMSFYSDVQLQIQNLYLSHEDSTQHNTEVSPITDSLSVSSTDTVTHQLSVTNELSTENSSHHNGTTTTHEKLALEIAAEQMRLYSQNTLEEQRSLEEVEEQTIYAFAIHHIQLMVYMKLPLDISSSLNIRQSMYNHVTHTITGNSDSLTSDFYHSVYADEASTVGSHDSGNEFDLDNNDDQVTDLVLKTVQIQIEVLEKVYRETRQVAPIPKPLLPRFVTIPELFEHEESIALRTYLLPDGRTSDESDTGLLKTRDTKPRQTAWPQTCHTTDSQPYHTRNSEPRHSTNNEPCRYHRCYANDGRSNVTMPTGLLLITLLATFILGYCIGRVA
ncbi:unnamed protein product [Rotaria sp. Silwood2]|nr:unnamed protein product [Rotaria sp. Silwood2]